MERAEEDSGYRFCGRVVSREDLDLIVEVVDNTGVPRTELAMTVCELLGWERPNGKLKTVEATAFLVELEGQGLLRLPAAKNEAGTRSKPKRSEAGEPGVPITGSVRECGVVLEQVKTQRERDMWKELIDRYHYLGYKIPFGAHVRYLLRHGNGAVLGCLQYSSPALKVACRDGWIGWEATTRERYLQKIVQQSRFLILPWVRVKGLASHVLGLSSKRIALDWLELYAIKPVLIETFVDVSRFQGTCYRAANWQQIGVTTGRGRMDVDHRAEKIVKSVWMYPLDRRFRQHLGVGHEAQPADT